VDERKPLPGDSTLVESLSMSVTPSLKGLKVVHFSAQREHFLSHVVGCFAGFSDENG